MPAFKKFGPGDRIDNVLVLEPRWSVASGSGGWHGSPDGSASIALHDGPRRYGGTFQDVRYSPTWPLASYGQQVRSQPQTASIHITRMRPGPLDVSLRDPQTWGEEHWDTVIRLYEDYQSRDPDYVTSSYDYYCLYFQKDSQNIALIPGGFMVDSNTGQQKFISSSFTIESWVKPFLTSSAAVPQTIVSLNRGFWFGLTGSNGALFFSSSAGVFTSSFGVTERRWHHVAVSSDGTSGTFSIDLQDAGRFPQALSFGATPSYTASFTVGAQYLSPLINGNFERGNLSAPIAQGQFSFHGFMGEVRFWNGSAKTISQLSASYDTRLPDPSTFIAPFPAANGIVQFIYHLDDGPLGTPDGITGQVGSGALDAVSENDGIYNLHLSEFNDSSRPVWHPNDNRSFFVPKEYAPLSAPLSEMLVVDIPSAFYGRQISPNSLSMTCRAYSSGSYGLVRTLIDDGRGNLFLSGSACSSTLANREDYRGVEWNKVGNVFYGEGLVVIRDPSLLDFGGQAGTNTSHPNDTFQLSFRGTSKVPVSTLLCRIEPGELNASSNPTFWQEEEDGQRVRRHPSSSLRVSTVGVYDDRYRLVGVASLAEPIRVRGRDRILIRLRMDF